MYGNNQKASPIAYWAGLFNFSFLFLPQQTPADKDKMKGDNKEKHPALQATLEIKITDEFPNVGIERKIEFGLCSITDTRNS